VSGTFGETPGYVRIAWQACGEDPGIEFVAAEQGVSPLTVRL
jgi:hypothetical protein